MEVGAIEESITVSGASPLIETSNASQGTVLDRAQLEALPTPGRNASLMAVTMPTVVSSGNTGFNRQNAQSGATTTSRSAAAASGRTTTSSMACRSPI